MDDAVGSLDVGGDDVDAIVQLDGPINHGDSDRRAVQGRRLGHVDHIGGASHAVHHMVEQNLRQVAGRVGQQGIDGAFRQGGEGVVGRGKDGELTLAGQRVDQAGGVERGDQGAEVRIAGGDLGDGGQSFGSRLSRRHRLVGRDRFHCRRGGLCATTGRQYTGQDNQ